MDMMNPEVETEECRPEGGSSVRFTTEYTNCFNDSDLAQVLAMCADMQRRVDSLRELAEQAQALGLYE